MSEIRLTEQIPSNVQAGVVINDNGILKVQKLKFNGSQPVYYDSPIEVDNFYTFNTEIDDYQETP